MGEQSQAGTFERSCQHWSEAGQAGMEAFYRLATFDYQLLAQQLDWPAVFTELRRRFGPQLHLLDVACGSGQFPAALLKHGGMSTSSDLEVEYSLLDPSEYSVRTARRQLTAPFVPSQEYVCTLQQLKPNAAEHQILWATHALYCVPRSELEVAVDRMLTSLAESGLGFIAHASKDSHYIRFHDLYLKAFRSDNAEPYSTGEQIIETLQARVGKESFDTWSIDYDGTLDLNDRETAERYLQRCIFDDSITLDDMQGHECTRDYLRTCVDEANGRWRFQQRVWLIFFGGMAEGIHRLRRYPKSH